METIESGKGILKNVYETGPIAAALKRKREKLAETKGIGEPSDQEASEE